MDFSIWNLCYLLWTFISTLLATCHHGDCPLFFVARYKYHKGKMAYNFSQPRIRKSDHGTPAKTIDCYRIKYNIGWFVHTSYISQMKIYLSSSNTWPWGLSCHIGSLLKFIENFWPRWDEVCVCIEICNMRHSFSPHRESFWISIWRLAYSLYKRCFHVVYYWYMDFYVP